MTGGGDPSARPLTDPTGSTALPHAARAGREAAFAAGRNPRAGEAGPEILIVAGEASGDLHGARLLSEIRRMAPGVRAFGLGRDELQAAGLS